MTYKEAEDIVEEYIKIHYKDERPFIEALKMAAMLLKERVVIENCHFIKKGDKIWYVDFDTGEIEEGEVSSVYFKDGYIDNANQELKIAKQHVLFDMFANLIVYMPSWFVCFAEAHPDASNGAYTFQSYNRFFFRAGEVCLIKINMRSWKLPPIYCGMAQTSCGNCVFSTLDSH